MAEVALPLLIASTAMSAMGSLQQGDAAMETANRQNGEAQRQAESLRLNAEIAQKNSIARDDQTRRQQRQQIGSMLAASAEAGAGLNGDALRGSIYDAEMDSATIRYEGNLKTAEINDQAATTLRSGRAALEEGRNKQWAGNLNAFGSLMSGASSYSTGVKKGGY